MIDLKKMQRTDIDLVQEAVIPYMLCTAMQNLSKTGEWLDFQGWTGLLNNASGAVMSGIGSHRVQRLASEITQVTRDVLKAAKPLDTYIELVGAIALLTVDLVKDFKFMSTQNQGVLVSSMIVTEMVQDTGIADLTKCKAAAGHMRNKLNQLGYFI